MGFSSFDDYINKVAALGQKKKTSWNKLSHPAAAAVAGEWSCLFATGGDPAAGVLNGGTNRSFQTLDDRVAGAILHGGDVAPATKHLIAGMAGSAAATSMPALLRLVDLLGYYPRNDMTSTGAQPTVQSATFTVDAGTDIATHAAYDVATLSRVQFTTTGTLPAGLSLATDYWTVRQGAGTSKFATSRANAIAGVFVDITGTGTGTHTLTVGLPRATDGAGVEALSVVTTALGAGTPTYQLGYTNSAGVAGRLTPTAPALPTSKASAAVGLIPYSGTGSGKFGPYIPKQGGDAGVRSIETINLSVTHTSGAQAWLLAKEIASIPMAAIGVFTEREFVNAIPSWPKIEDGACLAWLLYNGAATPANSGFFGDLDFAWG